MRWSEIQRRGISISRLEEQRGWLGRQQRDPGADPAGDHRDDPTPRELRELEAREREEKTA
jgi:hypothetical protein